MLGILLGTFTLIISPRYSVLDTNQLIKDNLSICIYKIFKSPGQFCEVLSYLHVHLFIYYSFSIRWLTESKVLKEVRVGACPSLMHSHLIPGPTMPDPPFSTWQNPIHSSKPNTTITSSTKPSLLSSNLEAGFSNFLVNIFRLPCMVDFLTLCFNCLLHCEHLEGKKILIYLWMFRVRHLAWHTVAWQQGSLSEALSPYSRSVGPWVP